VQGRIVEMPFFGKMSVEEAAEVLGMSVNTVIRDGRLARTWLRLKLQGTTTEVEPGHDG